MTGLVAEPQHATDFQRRFHQLFTELSGFARSKGITGCFACGGECNGEDPEDFAQECLIEYSHRAQRAGFQSVQTMLIKRIAHDRLVDAWRRRGRIPSRQELEAATRERTDEAASDRRFANPVFPGVSNKALDILRLKLVAEWRDREIAAALGMTVDGVRSSLKRSRQRIKTCHAREIVSGQYPNFIHRK